ncbi:glycosyltransferase, partial [Vibrio cholerae]|nr:glycosyltransferase [Vibrio cholerae]
IEGPLNVSFKNTELALEIAKKSNADEVWLLTSTPVGAMKGVDKLFSRVPISKVGKIYASCDILVKLSTVEGMFGPPLEAFHCGCTSITYDVTGYDEYIKHSSNALVSFTREDEEVLNFINQLCADKNMIDNLKFEALNTANDWPDWDSSSKLFNDICLNIVRSEVMHNYTSSFKAASLMWDTYCQSVENAKTGN